MSLWWRAYDEAVDDPKLGALTDRQHRAWFNLCCITSQNGGKLPAMPAVAFKLRTTVEKAKAIVAELVALELFDLDGETGECTPHNWRGRQFQSDVSTERVKQFRKRQRNVSSTVSETPPDTETEPETEKKEEDAPCGAPSPPGKAYAFESGVIRLNSRDFEQWKANFSHIDVGAELLALTEWAGQKRSWFNAVKGALAKKNQQAKERKDKLAEQGGFKWNGIEGVI